MDDDFNFVSGRAVSQDAPDWFSGNTRGGITVTVGTTGPTNAPESYSVDGAKWRPEVHQPLKTSISHSAPDLMEIKGISRNPANYGREGITPGEPRPAEDFTAIGPLQPIIPNQTFDGQFVKPRIHKQKVSGRSNGEADTMLGSRERSAPASRRKHSVGPDGAGGINDKHHHHSQHHSHQPAGGQQRPVTAPVKPQGRRAGVPTARMRNHQPPPGPQISTRPDEWYEGMNSHPRATRPFSSSSGSAPTFKPASATWRITPGGHGLHQMQNPRLQVKTVVERPTTALYGEEAKKEYYKKYPGALSPLLNELLIKREQHAFFKAQEKARGNDSVDVEVLSGMDSESTAPGDYAPPEPKVENCLEPYLLELPQRRDDPENPVGMHWLLHIHLHTLIQDHPDARIINQQSRGSRRLGQTGMLFVVFELRDGKAPPTLPGQRPPDPLPVFYKWTSCEAYARRVKEKGSALPGCERGGTGTGSQRQAMWPHGKQDASVQIKVSTEHEITMRAYETCFLGPPVLIGTEVVTASELAFYAEHSSMFQQESGGSKAPESGRGSGLRLGGGSAVYDPSTPPAGTFSACAAHRAASARSNQTSSDLQRSQGGGGRPQTAGTNQTHPPPSEAAASVGLKSDTDASHAPAGFVSMQLKPRDGGQPLRLALHISKVDDGFCLPRVTENKVTEYLSWGERTGRRISEH